MNLVINALSARWGGGQTYLINLLKYADDFPEIKIHLLASSSFVDHTDSKGIEIIKPNFSSKNIIYRFFWQRWYLPKLLKKLKADVLFCPGGTVNTHTPPDCLMVVAFRNMLIIDEHKRRKYPLGYTKCRLALLKKASTNSFRKADLVIFISEYAKNVIDQRISDRKGESTIIHHGLSDNFRTGQRNDVPRLQSLPKDDYLLYVSIIDVYKAHIEVIQAYHLFCQGRNTKEKLLLVGPAQPFYIDSVMKEIERLGLDDRVIIAGTIPYADMPSVYHHAKAHIFASTCENCPNIVLESLGSGRPLFLSDRASMPELAGDCAVYFDPDKPHELADLLLRHLDDEQWMKEMGHKAFERSLLYSWEATAKKIFQAFEGVLAAKEKKDSNHVCE